MIPAKIHYCWFGGRSMGKRERACLNSWKRVCPDFQLVRWDESNVSLEDNLYVRQAYEAGKWAFVSDYVRLKALCTQGGFYLDTDVELLKTLEPFRQDQGVMGFEDPTRISTALMAAQAGHPFFQFALAQYDALRFVRPDGSFDYTTNVERVTAWLREQGLKSDGTAQQVAGVRLYPAPVFSPKDLETGRVILREETVAIHHFQASWMPGKNRFHRRLAQLLGPSATRKIKGILGKET